MSNNIDLELKDTIKENIIKSFSDTSLHKIHSNLHQKPFVVEGANGSIGTAVAIILDCLGIQPDPLFVTTYSSNPNKYWRVFKNLNLFRLEDGFNSFRKNLVKIEGLNVFYAAGYGQPSKFDSDMTGVVKTNINQLIFYKQIKNGANFAYMSTSEIYSGVKGSPNENSSVISSPQQRRGIYIESKRLGEAITENLLDNFKRRASYRVALAFPIQYSPNDSRLLADLVKKAKKNKKIHLTNGSSYLRQYQYSPFAVVKILGSLFLGKNNLYNCGGEYTLTIGELGQKISDILNVPFSQEEQDINDGAPTSVMIKSDLINKDSEFKGLSLDLEAALKLYMS